MAVERKEEDTFLTAAMLFFHIEQKLQSVQSSFTAHNLRDLN